MVELLWTEMCYGDYWFVGANSGFADVRVASTVYEDGARTRAAVRRLTHAEVRNGAVAMFIGRNTPDWAHAHRNAIVNQISSSLRVSALRGELLYGAIAVVGRGVGTAAARRSGAPDGSAPK
ncbi:MAG TPA: hypothetical protein VMV69_15770 [Pirellulales bacterium]|nr:hypothetical protein [Pirellulales bacterium]